MNKRTLKSLTAIAVVSFAIAGSAAAVVKSGGLAFETSGVKVSLDLTSPAGAKVLFQRAD